MNADVVKPSISDGERKEQSDGSNGFEEASHKIEVPDSPSMLHLADDISQKENGLLSPEQIVSTPVSSPSTPSFADSNRNVVCTGAIPGSLNAQNEGAIDW